jgi:hypothetical protein
MVSCQSFLRRCSRPLEWPFRARESTPLRAAMGNAPGMFKLVAKVG